MKLQTITHTSIAANSIMLAAAAGSSLRGSGSIQERALGLFSSNNRIIGGDPALEDRFIYAVSLSDEFGHFCGGSLIARDVVLSAAHCDEQGQGQYQAIVGRHAQDDTDGQELSVKKAVPHPNYDSAAADKDFLLIFWNEPANSNINVVKLNSDAKTPSVGSPVTVVGWGDVDPSDAGQKLANELMEVEVNVISNEECDRSAGDFGSYQGSITSNMLCAKEEGGGEDSCQGDSGGPLIVKGSTASEDLQVGVVSWGIGCASEDYPGVYARVSAQYDWIREQVCKHSAYASSEFDCDNVAPSATTTSGSDSTTPTMADSFVSAATNTHDDLWIDDATTTHGDDWTDDWTYADDWTYTDDWTYADDSLWQ